VFYKWKIQNLAAEQVLLSFLGDAIILIK